MNKLYIDTREKSLYNQLKNLYINAPIDENPFEYHFEYKTLDIGDAIITNNEEPLLIFERKSISDMLASLKDGRYLEQSYRLQNFNLHNHLITYIIEGNINIPQKNTIVSTFFSLNYNKQFSTLKTNNLQETAFFLFQYLKKILKQKDVSCIINNKSCLEDKSYSDVIKTSKKSNIDKDNICEIMLAQIPGISSQCAKAISKKFKTMIDLIVALQDDENCLNDLYVETNKTTRKINKTAIQNIKDYLMQ